VASEKKVDSSTEEETIEENNSEINNSEEIDAGRIIMYRQIGAKVAYYLTLRRLTQDELARRIRLSRSTLNRIERGRHITLYNIRSHLAILFEISIKFL